MTASKEAVLISHILKKHGARRDLRLWRNETALAWVGQVKGRTPRGDVVLRRGARPIQAGLFVGSADLIGITGPGCVGHPAGRFIFLEVKTPNTPTRKHQKAALALVRSMGGIAEIVKSVEDVTAILGEPPK